MITIEGAREILEKYKPQTGYEEGCYTFNLAEAVHPKVVVEIGVADGGSLLLWSKMLDKDGLLIGIDAHYYVAWDLGSTQCKTLIVEGDTRNPATRAALVNVLNGREIDFLRIDGGHSYDAVKNDYEKFSGLVRNGGLIVFHDTYSSKEVQRYVKELEQTLEITYIEDSFFGPGKADTAYLFKKG